MKQVVLLLSMLIGVCFLGFSQGYYFPPTGNSTNWDTVSPELGGFDSKKMDSISNFLKNTNSDGYIILYKGKILKEQYFGNFTKDSIHAWNSAGKTMTALSIGIAKEKGLLKLNDPISKIYKSGWTSCTKSQEDKITVEHLLKMTSGLDDVQTTNLSSDPKDLNYLTVPDTRWAYHTGAYRILMKTITSLYGKDVNIFNKDMFQQKIGMNAVYINEVAYSKLRSMARFGHLLLNNAIWEKDTLLKDTGYLSKMLNSSQSLNQAYGYLTWLNGKSSFMVPALRKVFQGSLYPDSPKDMYAALGKDDQKIYIIPSWDMVICRFGKSGTTNGVSLFAYSDFDVRFWEAINYARLLTPIENNNQIINNNQFGLFPNPMVSNVLNCNNPINSASIRFYDGTGKFVFSSDLKNKMGLNFPFKGIMLYIISDKRTGLILEKGKLVK